MVVSLFMFVKNSVKVLVGTISMYCKTSSNMADMSAWSCPGTRCPAGSGGGSPPSETGPSSRRSGDLGNNRDYYVRANFKSGRILKPMILK